jgi:hypothetical protein
MNRLHAGCTQRKNFMDDYIGLTALAVSLTCVAIAAGVALLSHGQDKGLMYWAAGFATNAVVYGLISLNNPPVGGVGMVLTNAAIACTLALVAECACRFQFRNCSRLLIWMPVAIFTAGLFLLMDNANAQTVIGGLFLAMQCLLIAAVLLQKGQHTSLGVRMVAVGAVVTMGVFLIRSGTSLVGSATPLFVSGSGSIQANTFQMSVIGLMLVALGFDWMIRPHEQE